MIIPHCAISACVYHFLRQCFTLLKVFSPLGKIKEALADIKVALDLRPSAQLFVMSGTLLFMQEVRKTLDNTCLNYVRIFQQQN